MSETGVTPLTNEEDVDSKDNEALAYWKNKNKALRSENDKLLRENNVWKEKSGELDKCREQVSELQNQIKECEERTNKHLQKIAKLQQIISDLTDSKNDTLDMRFEQVTETNVKLVATIEDLQRRLAVWESGETQTDTPGEPEKEAKPPSRIRDMVANLEKGLNERDAELKELEKKRFHELNSLRKLNEKDRRKFEYEIEVLHKQIEESDEKVEELQAELETARSEGGRCEEKDRRYEQVRNEWNVTKEAMQKQVEELQAELEAAMSEVRRCEENDRRYKAENEQMQESMERASTLLNERDERNRDLEIEVKGLRQDIDRLQGELDNKTTEIDALKESMERASTLLNDSDKRNRDLIDASEDLRQDIDRLQGELDNKTNEIDDMKEAMRKQDHAKDDSENKGHAESRRMAEALKSECSGYIQRVKALTETIKDRESLIHVLKEENAELERRDDETKASCANLCDQTIAELRTLEDQKLQAIFQENDKKLQAKLQENEELHQSHKQELLVMIKQLGTELDKVSAEKKEFEDTIYNFTVRMESMQEEMDHLKQDQNGNATKAEVKTLQLKNRKLENEITRRDGEVRKLSDLNEQYKRDQAALRQTIHELNGKNDSCVQEIRKFEDRVNRLTNLSQKRNRVHEVFL